MQTKENILNKFLSRKGQICSLEIEKTLKLRKGISGRLIKREKTQARAGVNYSNIGEVKDSGREVSKLPYGEWEIFPHTIIHNGGRQYRFRSMQNAKKEIEYYLNGARITEDQARELALASQFNENKPIVFNVKEENIKDIK